MTDVFTYGELQCSECGDVLVTNRSLSYLGKFDTPTLPPTDPPHLGPLLHNVLSLF